jgi:hypothetical protein
MHPQGEAAAAINWVLKDGAGRLGRFLFARWGRELDCELKQFRLAGDLLMEAGAWARAVGVEAVESVCLSRSIRQLLSTIGTLFPPSPSHRPQPTPTDLNLSPSQAPPWSSPPSSRPTSSSRWPAPPTWPRTSRPSPTAARARRSTAHSRCRTTWCVSARAQFKPRTHLPSPPSASSSHPHPLHTLPYPPPLPSPIH